MRGKAFILFIFLTCILFMGLSFDKGFNYSKVEKLEWEDLDKTYVKPKVVNVTIKIRKEEVSEVFVKERNLFPYTERWVIKKYDNCYLYTTITDKDGFPDIYLDNIKMFPNVNALLIDMEKYAGVVFFDNFNNIITMGSAYSVYFNDIKNEENNFKIMLKMKGEGNRLDDSRLIDAKGELLFVAGWENEYRVVPMYAYTKLYKFNLKEKQVEVFDSYPYGIFIYGFDVFEGYSPNYDISKDHRYFYIPGVQDHEYSNIAYIFDRENVKVQGGLYVYDWWESRLYKLVDGTVSDVTNNTDDGYVYYKVRIYDKKKREAKEWCYRFKNPEEMLKQITE